MEVTTRYDATCRICAASVAILDRLDTSGTFRFEPFDDGISAGEMLVLVERKTFHGWAGIATLARLSGSRWLAPLVWIDRFKATRSIAKFAYRIVARNRHRLQRVR
ncbi:MAG: DCC1-like thiol-disulfide oxidoreductase family protein [Actinomycetota bacterium]|nr:DCC1-like thiol-disulfide oxidoreductase family protein [Actinomycetota bacterium]